MKLLIIRHGDPDYAADSVTKKGAREAEMLAERLSHLNVHTFYVSPLGRAQRTAAPALQLLHKDAVTLALAAGISGASTGSRYRQPAQSLGFQARLLDAGSSILRLVPMDADAHHADR